MHPRQSERAGEIGETGSPATGLHTSDEARLGGCKGDAWEGGGAGAEWGPGME